jgi:hypothetical protein
MKLEEKKLTGLLWATFVVLPVIAAIGTWIFVVTQRDIEFDFTIDWNYQPPEISESPPEDPANEQTEPVSKGRRGQ